MIQYPISTIVRKSVPKNAFYKHLELNTRLRTRFVEDVEKIVWTAKYTPMLRNSIIPSTNTVVRLKRIPLLP